ncbi:MAG TPA: NYN domain-containing protein [Bryobacteraceae bacterium]|nr:NYN domain-containing protein [Bryobacteraceae bacterium]
MQDKLNIAVFVDYDNIEIGLKSTLRREFDVSLALDALKERGDLVAKFAYANWGRQDGATRQMAENAVQMVQRIPSPRGDKNGADINLALDALEMAFTHTHVNAFAIVSGDSDFIPLVNKLKEYGKTVFVVGGKAFTSTILQQNCNEFISFESLLADVPEGPVTLPGEIRQQHPQPQQRQRGDRPERGDRGDRGERGDRGPRGDRQRPAPLDLAQAMPLVERALQVLERRAVQPQLGLLKSTMLQLDSAFNERAYGASSFSDFVERLKKSDLVNVTGAGGRYVIERKGSAQPEHPTLKQEDLLAPLRDVLENHRMELESGCPVEDLEAWFKQEQPSRDVAAYGFQEFLEFLNYAQDKTVVRMEPTEEQGMQVSLGAEFYPPAVPPAAEPVAVEEPEEEVEVYEPQPYVEGQPTIFEPNPPPAKVKRTPMRKRTPKQVGGAPRRVRRKKPE